MSLVSPQNEQQDTAIKALESLCEHSQDGPQVLKALRSVPVDAHTHTHTHTINAQTTLTHA